MSFFRKKEKEAQDAEFKDVKEMSLESETESSNNIAQEEAEVISESEPVQEPKFIPENEMISETDSMENSEDISQMESESADLPNTETDSYDELPQAADFPVETEDSEPVNDEPVIPEASLDLPMGKYNLQKLYKEIGEEYCHNHASDPEESLREKVGIVNALKKKSDELRNTLISLCRSPLLFFLILLLAGMIVVTIANNVSAVTVIACIPNAVIVIGCLIIFVQGLAKKIGKTGFGLLSGVLTFYLALGFIPVVSIFLIGVILRFNGDSGSNTAAIALILFAIILAIINWFYWGGLKKTTRSAITIASGGISELKVSFFVMFVSFIKLVASVFTVVAYFIFNASFPALLDRFVGVINQALGEAVITDSITNKVTNINMSNIYFLAALVLDVLIMLLVFILLNTIRGLNKAPEAAEELEE